MQGFFNSSIGWVENPFKSCAIENFLTPVTQWGNHKKNILKPHTLGVLLSDKHFGKVSLESDESTYPIDSFE